MSCAAHPGEHGHQVRKQRVSFSKALWQSCKNPDMQCVVHTSEPQQCKHHLHSSHQACHSQLQAPLGGQGPCTGPPLVEHIKWDHILPLGPAGSSAGRAWHNHRQHRGASAHMPTGVIIINVIVVIIIVA
jgi:hypothetical protein